MARRSGLDVLAAVLTDPSVFTGTLAGHVATGSQYFRHRRRRHIR